jgi:hypothetical protein
VVADPVLAVLLPDRPNDGFEQIIISHHHLSRLTVASIIPAAAIQSQYFSARIKALTKAQPIRVYFWPPEEKPGGQALFGEDRKTRCNLIHIKLS